jgi:protein farnesyltransferase/geranylgeranyltransferase type-1 subunit alpha
LNTDLEDELEFIDIIAEDNPKNYQVYHHRQRIIEAMAKLGTADFERELKFTEELIVADNKNYHVWSYRCITPLYETNWETMACKAFRFIGFVGGCLHDETYRGGYLE